MAFNMPLPTGVAGASPLELASRGSLLAGELTGGGQSSADMRYLPPDVLDYIENMTAIGYDAATAMEVLDYQAKRDDADRQYQYYALEQEAASALERAQIAANAQKSAAASGSAAQRYAADQALKAAQEHAAAARYAADQALQGIKVQEANRLKIAAAELKLKAQQVASEELGAPSNWRKQAGFLRGMDMTQENITPQAIAQSGEALGPVAPEMLTPGTAAPSLGGTATPQPNPYALRGQQAVVGEQGPELATQTPQGTQVTPIPEQQAWWLKKQGVQGMATGGTVPYRPSQEERRGWYTDWWGQQQGDTPAESTTPAEPSTPAEPAAQEPPYLEMLRSGAYVPLWQAWGGPRTKPEVGMNTPISMPHEINYGDFLRLTPTEQQMAFADWEALGMAPDTAFAIMQRSAMRGTARAATAYG